MAILDTVDTVKSRNKCVILFDHKAFLIFRSTDLLEEGGGGGGG